MLTLQETLVPEVEYTVLVSNVFDVMGTPIDTLNNSAEFFYQPSLEPPYILEGQLSDNQQTITLTFSHDLQKESAENLDNYRIEPSTTISNVSLNSTYANIVTLQVTKLIPLGSENARHILFVENVKSTDGIAVQTGRGDRIAFNLAKQDLSEVFTYPNPYSPNSQTDGITFANLTQSVTIRILTFDGRVIRILEETDGNGGLLWDTKNSAGEFVSSGIYIYYIISDSETKAGKLAIIR